MHLAVGALVALLAVSVCIVKTPAGLKAAFGVALVGADTPAIWILQAMQEANRNSELAYDAHVYELVVRTASFVVRGRGRYDDVLGAAQRYVAAARAGGDERRIADAGSREAQVYARTGDYEAALRSLEQGVRSRWDAPRAGRYFGLRMELLVDAQRHDDALKCLDDYLAWHPDVDSVGAWRVFKSALDAYEATGRGAEGRERLDGLLTEHRGTPLGDAIAAGLSAHARSPRSDMHRLPVPEALGPHRQ